MFGASVFRKTPVWEAKCLGRVFLEKEPIGRGSFWGESSEDTIWGTLFEDTL